MRKFPVPCRKFPVLSKKFRVPLRREFGCKSLNSLADWANTSSAAARPRKPNEILEYKNLGRPTRRWSTTKTASSATSRKRCTGPVTVKIEELPLQFFGQVVPVRDHRGAETAQDALIFRIGAGIPSLAVVLSGKLRVFPAPLFAETGY
jgi:hypothetical protein